MTCDVRLRLAFLVLVLIGACAAPATTEPAAGPDPSRTTRNPGPLLVDTRCADVVVLALRGAGQAADKNHGAGQEILASVKAMSGRLHHESDATVRIQGIPYRAESAPTSAIQQSRVDDGVNRTRAAMTRIARGCPRSRLALVGFSQGAQAVHDLAAELPASLVDRVALIAMIADPLRDPDDSIGSWTYDTAAPGPGKAGRGPALGRTFGRTAITFCTAGDEICNWPPGGYPGPLSDTHRHFYETSAHARSTGQQMAAILLRNGL